MIPRTLVAIAIAAAPAAAFAQETANTVEDRLRALEERQAQLERALEERDARIRELEAERHALPAAGAGVARSDGVQAASPTAAPEVVPAGVPEATGSQPDDSRYWGRYEGGKGIVLARSEAAEVDLSLFTYVRYLNQLGLAETYTDSFGRTTTLDRRNDLQLQKVNLSFKGWLGTPDLRYLVYTWTNNTSQGQPSQVVVAGNLSYKFDDAFSLAGGIGALPSTRSTNYTFPNWLRVDNRTIADEFFRGSYTTGVWGWGKIGDTLRYRVMVGNNLSQLGIDAGELDAGLNTVSGALWWMPTTGEYGPGEGFGDYEEHDDLATLFSLHFTHSREDRQSQPGLDDFENAQIRLSDGTVIFSPDPFGTGTTVEKATYQMASLSAGMKYRGWSLDGEYFWRRVDDFKSVGLMPFDRMSDSGFQLQASAMLVPRTLQAYLSGSKIFGEFGDPWDLALGVNWFPGSRFPGNRRELRVNLQGLYLVDSPVGYASVPFAVGGNGWVISSDVMLNF